METFQRLRPVALGLTFALTIAIMYTVCAALWMILQDSALDFLNALFHGLDFRKLQAPGRGFGFGTFVYPLIVLSVWGFVAGALFGAIGNWLRIRS